jgi:hypothetical protein
MEALDEPLPGARTAMSARTPPRGLSSPRSYSVHGPNCALSLNRQTIRPKCIRGQKCSAKPWTADALRGDLRIPAKAREGRRTPRRWREATDATRFQAPMRFKGIRALEAPELSRIVDSPHFPSSLLAVEKNRRGHQLISRRIVLGSMVVIFGNQKEGLNT